MSRIRNKDTKPEVLVRKILFANGFRYRLHNSSLLGKPDIVLSKYKTIIFVNGCFWHGHENCKYFVLPKTRTDWWCNKINQNKLRDLHNVNQLQKEGWTVFIVYECELKKNIIVKTMKRIINQLIKIEDN